MQRTLLFLFSVFALGDAAPAQGWFGGAGPASFDAVYGSGGQTSWLLMGLVAVGAGLIIYFTAGTGTAAVGTLGSWIGSAAGLSGAAAKSYGLALLGGGAVAAGGLGVKGGVAVLTAALTFGQEAVVPYTFGIIRERYDRAAFEERVREAPRFPLPRSGTGPESYKAIMRHLESFYRPDLQHSDPRNVEVVEFAMRRLKERHWKETISDVDTARVAVLSALLLFHQGEDRLARIQAETAMLLVARGNKEIAKSRDVPDVATTIDPAIWAQAAKGAGGYGLATAIWATAALSEANVDVKQALTAMDAVFGMEPKSGLAPLAAAIFMDRLIARQDIMTIAHLDALRLSARSRLTDEKARSATLLVIMTRALVALKLEQSLVTASKDAPRGTTADGAAIKARADKSFAAYDAALKLLDDITKDLLRDDAFSKDAANRAEVVKLIDLISAYKNDRLRLGGIIAALP
jgi:hypothetical protein